MDSNLDSFFDTDIFSDLGQGFDFHLSLGSVLQFFWQPPTAFESSFEFPDRLNIQN